MTTYGAVASINSDEALAPINHHDHDPEYNRYDSDSESSTAAGGSDSAPLIAPRGGKRGRSLTRWLNEELGAPDMVLISLVITISTSMLDSVMYTLFQTFATNQTGNTVFLTLAILHRGERKVILAGTSLLGFMGAGLIMGQLGARFGHQRRAWVLATMTFQTVVLFLFCVFVSPLVSPIFHRNGRYEWVVMLLSAVQGGPQVVMGTNLGIPEMTTATITTVYSGIAADPKLLLRGAISGRDRRLMYLGAFWAGAFLGLGIEQLSNAWIASVLAALIKFVALVLMCFAKEKQA